MEYASLNMSIRMSVIAIVISVAKSWYYKPYTVMGDIAEDQSNPDLELKSDSDGVIAISLCVMLLLGLLMCGFYLWKNRKSFGFEDRRYFFC